MQEHRLSREIETLVERARDLSIDLAAAQQRELERRFSKTMAPERFRVVLISKIKQFPRLYRFALRVRKRLI